MADETLRRNLDRAFDPGPDFPHPLLLSRTMAMLHEDAAATGRDGRRRSRERPWPSWPRPVMRLAAIVLAVIVVVAATAAFLAVHRLFAPVPARPLPFKVGNSFLPVGNSWFFSANDGAVQLEPSDASTATQQGVLITHDGGRTWLPTTLNVVDFPLVNLRWLDSQHIVAVLDSVGPPNLLETTADGGAHWQSTKMGSLMLQPAQTFFLDPHEGWALCINPGPCDTSNLTSPSRVYHTVDSGAHWQPLGITSVSAQVVPSGLVFTDSNHGFINASSSDGVGRLFVTEDGGQTWRLVLLPAPPGGWQSGGADSTPCATCVLPPAMFGKQGVLLLEQRVGDWFTYTTSDGGLTWANPLRIPVREPQNIHPWQGVQDPSNWWIVDSQGAPYRTMDGGKNWQSVISALPRGYRLDSVVPVGGNVLWGTAVSAASGAGQLDYPVRSVDGGATWSLVKLPATSK